MGQNALTRFYALHVAIVPLSTVILISLHLWRVRKDGGLAANDVTGTSNPSGSQIEREANHE